MSKKPRERDDLDPARGVLLGMIVGSLMWLPICWWIFG